MSRDWLNEWINEWISNCKHRHLPAEWNPRGLSECRISSCCSSSASRLSAHPASRFLTLATLFPPSEQKLDWETKRYWSNCPVQASQVFGWWIGQLSLLKRHMQGSAGIANLVNIMFHVYIHKAWCYRPMVAAPAKCMTPECRMNLCSAINDISWHCTETTVHKGWVFLNHLPNVKTHFYYPQAFLSLNFQCRDEVSKSE